VAGSCEYGDELPGAGATDLVSYNYISDVFFIILCA
jgi:hypothetical protein